MTNKFVLYAPNVHTGGGYVLLQALLDTWPKQCVLVALLDQRARTTLRLPVGTQAYWIKRSVSARLRGEFMLHALCRSGETVLCFHGLPPLLPNSGRVIVFQQNRHYLGLSSLSDFSIRTALRLAFERMVSRLFRHRAAEYVVQTPTMAHDLLRWYGKCRNGSGPKISVFPFVDELPRKREGSAHDIEWDFVYVADGEAHKNHRRLLEALSILAKENIKPRIALTLSLRDAALIQGVENLRADCGVEVHNLGHMPREAVLNLYKNSRALIFPSLAESFGLPLIEAQQLGLPILASELDYVRDVCEPVHTFDPLSAISIARAIKRFLGLSEPTVRLHSPAEFWMSLLDRHVSVTSDRVSVDGTET